MLARAGRAEATGESNMQVLGFRDLTALMIGSAQRRPTGSDRV
jgi:hypothetical protein